MPFTTNLVFNISTGQFVLSAANPSAVAGPLLYGGDTGRHFSITFVQNTDVFGRVEIVPSAGTGLQVGIGTPGGTPLTSATAETPVSDAYPVTLPMNTSTLVAAIAAAYPSPFDTTLEFRTTGADSQRYQTPIRIFRALLSDVLIDTPAPDTAIGIAAANAAFVPQDGPAGGYFVLRSAAGGLRARVYLGDDGALKVDPF